MRQMELGADLVHWGAAEKIRGTAKLSRQGCLRSQVKKVLPEAFAKDAERMARNVTRSMALDLRQVLF